MGKDDLVKKTIDFYDYFKESGNIQRPSWDEYFMSLAMVASSRASCLKFAVGAVIEKDHEVLAMGYNGAPKGIESCYERFMRGMGLNACYKTENNIDDNHKNSGKCPAIHSEENAMQRIDIRNAMGSRMYSVVFPCIECSRRIANKGIAEVIYIFDYIGEERAEAKAVFDEAGVDIRQLNMTPERFFEILSRPWALYVKRVPKEDFKKIGN